MNLHTSRVMYPYELFPFVFSSLKCTEDVADDDDDDEDDYDLCWRKVLAMVVCSNAISIYVKISVFVKESIAFSYLS